VLTDEQIIETVTANILASDEEEEKESNENVYVPSVTEMLQRMTETRNFLESYTVPENVWNSFCILESYVNNVNFSNKCKRILKRDRKTTSSTQTCSERSLTRG
jgi:hypothetical protein